jgi:hypothetical protein
MISFGQMSDYSFKRNISEPKSNWHKIVLPDEIFCKVSASLSDIRIYGVTNNTDTIEVPYILNELKETISIKEMPFKLINTSNKDNEHFFTFETNTDECINQIKLDFSQDNFDWVIKLEGSQNLIDWFTIKDNCRILSIITSNANYKYTNLVFPDSKFRYYRIQFNTSIKPNLLSSVLLKEIKDSVNSREYSVVKTKIEVDKNLKQTIIQIELQSISPVSAVKIEIKDKYDYYRPVTIQVASDSIKTQNEWNYIYHTFYSGILSSFEDQHFNFETVFTKKIKIIIDNNDNEPLQIESVEVEGNIFELTARFDKEAEYSLVYGNKKAVFPQYDIENFKDKIPTTLSYLSLGNEESISSNKNADSPLFENKLWLWLIMILMIIIIGWFSLSMIRKKS